MMWNDPVLSVGLAQSAQTAYELIPKDMCTIPLNQSELFIQFSVGIPLQVSNRPFPALVPTGLTLLV